jgi:hypothetical protein
MARFGMKGHAGRNRPKKPDRPMLSPVCHTRIVAGFGREGKSDDARKSRIFNNLGRFRAKYRPGTVFDRPASRASLELGESPIAAPQSSLWNEAGL